jgi:hypothetical protein
LAEDEVNGSWGFFQPLGSFAQLNTGQFAELNSVSCESPQNCTAAGEYATVGGTPKGNVTISVGQTTLAVVALKHGKATWTFPPKKLRPGTYQLTATYASSNGYDPVTSAKKKFVVTN